MNPYLQTPAVLVSVDCLGRNRQELLLGGDVLISVVRSSFDVTVSWAPEATSQCACYDITMAGLWMRDLACDAWVGDNSAHAV